MRSLQTALVGGAQQPPESAQPRGEHTGDREERTVAPEPEVQRWMRACERLARRRDKDRHLRAHFVAWREVSGQGSTLDAAQRSTMLESKIGYWKAAAEGAGIVVSDLQRSVAEKAATISELQRDVRVLSSRDKSGVVQMVRDQAEAIKELQAQVARLAWTEINSSQQSARRLATTALEVGRQSDAVVRSFRERERRMRERERELEEEAGRGSEAEMALLQARVDELGREKRSLEDDLVASKLRMAQMHAELAVIRRALRTTNVPLDLTAEIEAQLGRTSTALVASPPVSPLTPGKHVPRSSSQPESASGGRRISKAATQVEERLVLTRCSPAVPRDSA